MSDQQNRFHASGLNIEQHGLAGIELREFRYPQIAAKLVLFGNTQSDVAIRACNPQVVGSGGPDVPKDCRRTEHISHVLVNGRKQGALSFDHQGGSRFIEVSNRERHDRRNNRCYRNDRDHLSPRQIFKVHKTRLYKEATA